MPITKLTIPIKLPDNEKNWEIYNNTTILTAALYWNGQLWDENQHYWTDDSLVFIFRIPHYDSLNSKFSNDKVREVWKTLELLCKSKIDVQILGSLKYSDQEPRSVDELPSLYLFTNLAEDTSPVRAGDTGQAIPLYLLPLSDEEKHESLGWMQWYKDHIRIWTLSNGPLETQAYDELTKVNSNLSRVGREVARTIEVRTKIPTYYYLDRWYPDIDEIVPALSFMWRILVAKQDRE